MTPKKTLTEQQALQRLTSLCSRAEYCIADMRRKMKAWELPDGAEERIVQFLLKEKYVDETRFAHAFVRDKFRYNHWGEVRIRHELQLRGIDANTIEDALTEMPQEEADETLDHLLRQKLKSTKGKTDYDVFLKLLRYSVGKGYTADHAHRCLQKIIKTDLEE